MKIKDDFHMLIDQINDEEALKGYYQLIERLNKNQTGELWNSLNEEKRKELLISYGESLNEKNLISHDDVKKQHEKWLRK